MKKHYETAMPSSYSLLKQNAKEHRKFPTEAERILWECLRGGRLGARFRRQHPVADYIPDFVCLSKMLVVEVDGGYHYVGNQPVNDEQRTAYLETLGYHVIRFTNEEVIGNIEQVLLKIKETMDNQNNHKEYHHSVVAEAPLLGKKHHHQLVDGRTSGTEPCVFHLLYQQTTARNGERRG